MHSSSRAPRCSPACEHVPVTDPGSASLEAPDYWWYRAREQLLEIALGGFVTEVARILDVGSADGPSVGWLRERGSRVGMDIDPTGLSPGDVCASALALPFGDGTFDVVTAFDVVEHCDPEHRAMEELVRVLAPGGRLLLSVPAYQWAWTRFDERAGHHRRYTRARLRRLAESHGLVVLRDSYLFAGTFPFCAADRLRSRVMERQRPDSRADRPLLPPTSPRVERLLLWASGLDRRLVRRRDLPFGSSVVIAAEKPRTATPTGRAQ